MSNLWQCYTWQGSDDTSRSDAEPAESWTSPEGAVEFLRSELTAHNCYSKQALVSALAALRRGEPVTMSRELDGGVRLHLEVTRAPVPENV